MTTAKNEFFIRLKHENCYLMGGKGGHNLLGGRQSLLGGIFPGGAGMGKFLASRETPPHSPNKENPGDSETGVESRVR